MHISTIKELFLCFILYFSNLLMKPIYSILSYNFYESIILYIVVYQFQVYSLSSFGTCKHLCIHTCLSRHEIFYHCRKFPLLASQFLQVLVNPQICVLPGYIILAFFKYTNEIIHICYSISSFFKLAYSFQNSFCIFYEFNYSYFLIVFHCIF